MPIVVDEHTTFLTLSGKVMMLAIFAEQKSKKKINERSELVISSLLSKYHDVAHYFINIS